MMCSYYYGYYVTVTRDIPKASGWEIPDSY